jgi:hypothetical protein
VGAGCARLPDPPPGGERGRVDPVRAGTGAGEDVVTTGSFPRRLVTGRADEIEAILPGARRLVMRGANALSTRDVADLGTAGGIVRMPSRNSLDIAPGCVFGG